MRIVPHGILTSPGMLSARCLVLTLCAFLIAPAWTQVPPPGVLVGPTPAASLRNAAVATRDQAAVVENVAQACARHAQSPHYGVDHFGPEFRTVQLQFQALRDRFAWMADLALQTGRPYAPNALAELDAGLNIISELLLFLEQQFAAGTLDRATIVRTCRAFADTMHEWKAELRRSSSRMGIAS